ncbi:hypothetical protein JXM67_12650 [candidate division WOR-3 bacterium]|nr:hypothetical protein [candidate division WOR-3 bacterium]
MAKARFFLFKGLIKVGNSLFGILTRCEEKDVFPKTSRWLKTMVLAGFITAIGTLSAASILSCACYFTSYPPPEIQTSSVTPNPTQGADSVAVKASVAIVDPIEPGKKYDGEDVFIQYAEARYNNTTTTMQATDGELNEPKEDLYAKIYVGNMEPGSTKVHIEVWSNHDDKDYGELDLEISEEE